MLGACATPSCEPLPGRPSHHVQGGFCNPPGSPVPTASLPEKVADGLRLAFERYRGPVPAGFVVPEAQALAAMNRPGSQDRITWLGHGTSLLRVGGARVLVDPIWSRYPSPLPPFGPERILPPPVRLAALPPADILLITHNHYDHLDLPTLRALPNKTEIAVVVPLGLGAGLRQLGFARVAELDWWQTVRVGDLEVWLLPAQHNSGRGLFDGDATLWASFALLDGRPGGARVYLSGDSGYRGHFREIGTRLGPFDLAVMNVGGYAPLRVAQAVHFTPEEGAQGVRDLRARRAMPSHWATYPLGTEGPFESGPAFARALGPDDAGRPRARILRVGETWEFREPAGAPGS